MKIITPSILGIFGKHENSNESFNDTKGREEGKITQIYT